MRIDALLIDLDGTVVDSKEAYFKAASEASRAIGIPRISKRSAFQIAKTLEVGEPVRQISWKPLSKKDIKVFCSVYKRIYNRYAPVLSLPFPGIRSTLRNLSRDFRMALVTSRPTGKSIIERELERLNIDCFFEEVVTPSHSLRPKPAPHQYLKAADLLRTPISQCTVVGDSVVDIQAGKCAGAKTIAVLSGLFCRDELELQKPDTIIDDLNSLVVHLNCRLQRVEH